MFCFFLFFPQILDCEAFQIFYPLLNFQTLEMFPVFVGKKRGKSGGKLFEKNGPKRQGNRSG